MGSEAIAGLRVSLRAVNEEDLAAIKAWYEEAVMAAYVETPHPLPLSREAGEGRSVGAGSGGVLVIERFGERGPIGLVEYEVKEDQLAVPFIALAKVYRGWGYGSEAVRLLEEWAVREGIAERFRTEVDARNGLGLYFWLRLGYRPVGWHAEGGRDSMTMIRES